MMGRFNFSATTCCVVVLSLFAQSTWATPLLDTSYPELPLPLLARQAGPIVPGGKPCGQNNATNRGCWKNQWNVSTDYEFFHPPAFSNRVVCRKSPSAVATLTRGSTTFTSPTSPTGWALMGSSSTPCSSTVGLPSPSCRAKANSACPDQFPGPTIEADWGDYVTVNVYNDMQDNGYTFPLPPTTASNPNPPAEHPSTGTGSANSANPTTMAPTASPNAQSPPAT